MGNCQAAEAAAVLLQHPGGRLERMYWSVSAAHVMAANPGHYVAGVLVTTAGANAGKLLKLLRPDDALHVGRVYHLVTFEDVIKVFGTRRCVKLSKLVARQERRKRRELREVTGGGEPGGDDAGAAPATGGDVDGAAPAMMAEMAVEVGKPGEEPLDLDINAGMSSSQRMLKCGHWRPTLQTIAEASSST